MGEILRRKYIDTEIKLIHVAELELYDIDQICTTPIKLGTELFFFCEVRVKDERRNNH